ncbi:uncharacterized protein LOC62_06G008558 [Vanrija pseudolonga]|uniref:Uncharacterized protein n=1 Tax=Vanrija pseudolonga TaxID=143232 RepID=A0AAF0YK22_9TREE|nr:hypothetical protein LOC62_06G008558 [Vanrija pseudolonga]
MTNSPRRSFWRKVFCMADVEAEKRKSVDTTTSTFEEKPVVAPTTVKPSAPAPAPKPAPAPIPKFTVKPKDAAKPAPKTVPAASFARTGGSTTRSTSTRYDNYTTTPMVVPDVCDNSAPMEPRHHGGHHSGGHDSGPSTAYDPPSTSYDPPSTTFDSGPSYDSGPSFSSDSGGGGGFDSGGGGGGCDSGSSSW